MRRYKLFLFTLLLLGILFGIAVGGNYISKYAANGLGMAIGSLFTICLIKL